MKPSERKLKITKQTIIQFTGALLLVLLFYGLTAKVYHLPFSYGDDHRILAMLHPEDVSHGYQTMMWGHIPNLKGSWAIDAHAGRFRPLSWAYIKGLCLLFKDNTFLWRTSNLLVLFFTIFFFLSILFCLECDIFSAFIITAFFLLGRNNEEWWTLIPPPQDIGECFMLAGMAIWVIRRKNKGTGFYTLPGVLFFAAALVKESFMFCTPCLLLADFLFFSPHKKILAKEYIASFTAFIIPLGCLLFSIVYAGKVYGYPYSNSVFSIILYNMVQFIAALGLFIAPLLFVLKNKTTVSRQKIINITLLLFIWLGVQIILLKGIKLDEQHHYLVPGIWIPLIVTALALAGLKKLSRKYYTVACALYLIGALLFAKNTYANVSSYSASLKAYYKMVDAIQQSPTSEIVYLSGNPIVGDWLCGTSLLLRYHGIETPIWFVSTADTIYPWQKAYIEHRPKNAFRQLAFNKDVFAADGKWIILVENQVKNGKINGNMSFLSNNSKNYFMVNHKKYLLQGSYYYFCAPYPGHSIGDILRGNHADTNYKGFYAIKMKNLIMVSAKR